MLGNPATACATATRLHHDHCFAQGVRRRAEERTPLVASITLLVMAIEIAAGRWTGCMALLADGIHMGGHAIAYGLAALRREATKRLKAITGGRVTDLHLWSVGQGGWTLVASAVSHASVTPEACRAALAGVPGLYHPVIELHPCPTCPCANDVD